jgi:hypothetical protein
MEPLEWAKQRKRAAVTQQSYRRRRDLRQTPNLDANELGKYISTLRQRGGQQLQQVANGLAGENKEYEPLGAFGRRSGNEYLGRLKVLQEHLVRQLPPTWDKADTLRGLRWFKRLLDIEDADRKLLRWLLDSERATPAARSAPSGQSSSQTTTQTAPVRDRESKTTSYETKRDPRWL